MNKRKIASTTLALSLILTTLVGCASGASSSTGTGGSTSGAGASTSGAGASASGAGDAAKKVMTAQGEIDPIGADYGDIVSIDIKALEHMVTLGVPPAVATYPGEGSSANYLAGFAKVYTSDELKDTTRMSQNGQPDIEAILSHEPDYIIASGWYTKHEEKLNAIAPTIFLDGMVGEDGMDDWRPYHRNLAVLFGKEDVAEANIVAYDKKVADALAQVGDMIEGKSAMIIEVNEKGIDYRSSKGYAGIYRELGFEMPKNAPTMGETNTIAVEALVDINPDFIFVSEDNIEMVEDLMETPIWNKLDAVKNGNIMFISHYAWVQTCGPLSEGLEISDTLAFLLEKKANA